MRLYENHFWNIDRYRHVFFGKLMQYIKEIRMKYIVSILLCLSFHIHSFAEIGSCKDCDELYYYALDQWLINLKKIQEDKDPEEVAKSKGRLEILLEIIYHCDNL